MYHYGEYDACEFSMSSYLVARGQDVDWLQAIPFFPRRMWGHKFCFIRAGSGVKKPSDLKGGRIGLRSYENTLALVTKGMLMNSYDLAVSDVTWVIVNKGHVGFKLPPSIRSIRRRKRRLEDLLVEERSTRKWNRTYRMPGFAAKEPCKALSGFERRSGILPTHQNLSHHAPPWSSRRYP
jgi:4,5-dihydroxyphthalate decarboxylase